MQYEIFLWQQKSSPLAGVFVSPNGSFLLNWLYLTSTKQKCVGLLSLNHRSWRHTRGLIPIYIYISVLIIIISAVELTYSQSPVNPTVKVLTLTELNRPLPEPLLAIPIICDSLGLLAIFTKSQVLQERKYRVGKSVTQQVAAPRHLEKCPQNPCQSNSSETFHFTRRPGTSLVHN